MRVASHALCRQRGRKTSEGFMSEVAALRRSRHDQSDAFIAWPTVYPFKQPLYAMPIHQTFYQKHINSIRKNPASRLQDAYVLAPISQRPFRPLYPAYFSNIIRRCRSSLLRARLAARRIAQIFASQSSIEACPQDIVELLHKNLDDGVNVFGVHCSECGSAGWHPLSLLYM